MVGNLCAYTIVCNAHFEGSVFICRIQGIYSYNDRYKSARRSLRGRACAIRPRECYIELDVKFKKFKMPKPAGSSNGLPQLWVLQTPNNPIEIQSQSEYIKIRVTKHQ